MVGAEMLTCSYHFSALGYMVGAEMLTCSYHFSGLSYVVGAEMLTCSYHFSGLGYMVGAEVTNIAKALNAGEEAWRWGLRVTPVMGLVAVLLILLVLQEPPRGQVEGGEHLKPTNFLKDLKDLATKSVLKSGACTCFKLIFNFSDLVIFGSTIIFIKAMTVFMRRSLVELHKSLIDIFSCSIYLLHK
jgi:hypothetical protein